ncbi:MAG: hypothetical protein AAF732_17205 [Pseudomonadota bacterium]
MRFNPDKYLPHLRTLDLSEADKRAFLEALHAILASFVDEAWEADLSARAANDNEAKDESDRRSMLG